MNRIREFRQARGWSLQQLAEASNTSKSQIDKLEKGARRLTVDWMVRLAKPLRCDPRELMSAAPDRPAHASFAPVRFVKEDNPDPGFIPVRGLARGKQKGETLFARGVIDYVPCPHYLLRVKNAYAFYMADDAMVPMYRPRQMLFVHPYKEPSPGNGVVVITRKGALLVREFVRATGDGVIVREYRPKRREITISNKDIAGLHAVAGTVEP